MTDYFALLDQPRSPWLDPEALKKVFHEKTLHTHPDAHAQSSGDGEGASAFTELNEAYQVLREPKRRLQHLLSLEESSPAGKGVPIPAEIEALFPEIAALLQEADGVVRKVAQSTNALSRSLVRPELLQTSGRIGKMSETVRQLHEEAICELHELNKLWRPTQQNRDAELHLLYLRFSYLTRWMTELDEKQMQLQP